MRLWTKGKAFATGLYKVKFFTCTLANVCTSLHCLQQTFTRPITCWKKSDSTIHVFLVHAYSLYSGWLFLENSENLHSYLLFLLKKHVIICTALAPENSARRQRMHQLREYVHVRIPILKNWQCKRYVNLQSWKSTSNCCFPCYISIQKSALKSDLQVVFPRVHRF